MSIIYTLKKIVDPIAARQEEAERKAQREEVRQQQAGDPPRYRCRTCGLEDSQGVYCPECLADTMERVAAPKETDEE
jgi:lipopolysaccharide biosynthesis regulator YciM